MARQLYHLKDLGSVNIDSWVAAMANIADEYGYQIEGFAEASCDACPGEYEEEFNTFAEENNLLFDENGEMFEVS